MYCRLVKKVKGVTPSPNSGGSSTSDTSVQFVFGETHLKAKASYMEDRVKQTLKIIQFFSENFQNIPVIIGGDFNEEPQNKPIADIMESTFIDLHTLSKIQQKTLSKNIVENYPAFTTFKYRDAEGYVKRTIDYFFIAD